MAIAVFLGMIATFAIADTVKSPIISLYKGEGMQTTCKIETLAVSPNFAFSDDLDPTPDEVKTALTFISVKYALDYEQLYRTNECESQFNNLAIGDLGKARGVSQFWYDTFIRNCPDMDYYSAKDQLHCQAQMWVRNHADEWTCFSRFFKELRRFNYDDCIISI